jgi:23S rRNA pseudouridine2605 synthase
MQRLSKVLAAAGVASRRACEDLIFEGRVTVNGEICMVPQTMVSLNKNSITVDGESIKRPERKKYFILNKPRGFLCSSRGRTRERLVIDLFDKVEERLFTVGRLDRDTQGLIIVTNDGYFAQDVIHPSSNVEKEYLVKVDQEITAEHLQVISKGCMVEDSFCKPTRVKKVRKGTVKVTVKEGKKREVRKLVERSGLSIRELTRIRIGDLLLGGLPEGHYRHLTPHEMDLLTGKAATG